MAEFRVQYSDDNYGYIYFEADNIEEAKQVLINIEDEGFGDYESLPGYFMKNKGGEFQVHIDEIEEV